MRNLFVIHGVMAMMIMVLGGCATTAVPRHLTLSVAPLDTVHADALVEAVSTQRPDWTIGLRADEGQRMNAVRSDNGVLGVCLAPDRIYENDETVAYLPMMCGTLTAEAIDDDLIKLIEKQTASAIDATKLDDEAMLDIVQKSSADDPLCFSVLPLWLADRQAFVSDHILAENYMIACARNIRKATTWVKSDALSSDILAGWLDMASSVMTTQPAYIRRAFAAALEHTDAESRVLGQGMEAHIELNAGKWTQAQLTLVSALGNAEKTDIAWISDLYAMKMYQAVYSAPGLNVEVFEEVMPSMYPHEGSFQRLAFRYALVTRTCRLAGILPDVTPKIVETCLPAVDIVLSDMPEKEHQDFIYLLERAVSDKRHPYLTSNTLSWLREKCRDGACAWYPELRRTALATSGLAPETRSFFESFDPQHGP